MEGFSGIDHILMGDDDLLMMKVKKKTDWKISFMPDSKGAVTSPATNGWNHFISQRRRHIAASKYFPIAVKLGYVLTLISKSIMMLFIVILFLGYEASYLSIGLLILTYFLSLALLAKMSIHTFQVSLIVFYPFWEIYYILNHLIIGPFGLFGQIAWGKR